MSTSASAPTSSAPAFPRVGDIFSSLNEFKLACHRAALAAGTELRIRAGDATFVYLYCRLREGCTVHKLTGDDDCSFRIHAMALRDASGGVRVSISSLDHSCPSTVRDARSRDGSAKAWTEQKIREVEESIEQGVSGVKKKLRKNRFRVETSSSESGEEDSEDGTRSDEAAPSSVPTQKHFPSAQEVARAVSKLVKAGPVAFPSVHQSFSTARELLIHLYAFAQSRGFTVHRKSDVSDKQHLRLICAHGHHRYATTKQGQCKVCIIADKGSDGLWRITSSELKHNHEIDEVDEVDEDENALPRSSKRTYFSATSSSTERREDKQPVQHAAFLPSSTPTALTPLDRNDLTAFLYSIFPAVPPQELELLVSFLAHLGISALEDLATLVLLEPSSLQHLVDAVQLPSLSPLEQASMRKAFRRCLEMIRQQAKADM